MLSNLANFLSRFLPNLQELSSEDRELLSALSVSNTASEPLAYTVVLVQLALSDHHFDKRERKVIKDVLHELFQCDSREAHELIDRAKQFVDNLGLGDSFVERIREEYSSEERATLYGIIDRLAAADGITSPSEQLVTYKFKRLLS